MCNRLTRSFTPRESISRSIFVYNVPPGKFNSVAVVGLSPEEAENPSVFISGQSPPQNINRRRSTQILGMAGFLPG